jgi:hypothetical protein
MPIAWLPVATLLVLAPVAPLFLNEPVHGRERVLFLAAWCTALVLAWLSDRCAASRWIAVAMLAAMVLAQRTVIQRYDRPSAPEYAQYQLMQSSTEALDLVPQGYRGLGYLHALAASIRLVDRRIPAALVPDEERLVALGAERGRRAWAWHDDCRCMAPLGLEYDDRVKRFEAAVRAGSQYPASLSLSLTDRGLRKFVHWQVEGPPGSVRFDVAELDRFEVPREGRLAFGRDATLRGNVLHLHVTIETTDGALIRSPLLALPLSPSGTIRWATPR